MILYPQSQTYCTHVLLPSQVSQYNKTELPAKFNVAGCAINIIRFEKAVGVLRYDTGSKHNTLFTACP
jgi:hypothetical protein